MATEGEAIELPEAVQKASCMRGAFFYSLQFISPP